MSDDDGDLLEDPVRNWIYPDEGKAFTDSDIEQMLVASFRKEELASLLVSFAYRSTDRDSDCLSTRDVWSIIHDKVFSRRREVALHALKKKISRAASPIKITCAERDLILEYLGK